ncbi:hypothetical protein GE09DRAFT_592459 [Coniochaeta sp. 2T2.1]|nr:hypothetical protein GE09DRAFT_592459 [Coniochaeta sp. 2T2.1]
MNLNMGLKRQTARTAPYRLCCKSRFRLVLPSWMLSVKCSTLGNERCTISAWTVISTTTVGHAPSRASFDLHCKLNRDEEVKSDKGMTTPVDMTLARTLATPLQSDRGKRRGPPRQAQPLRTSCSPIIEEWTFDASHGCSFVSVVGHCLEDAGLLPASRILPLTRKETRCPSSQWQVSLFRQPA